ncbi:hypothetical protein SH1V18_47940 [Vallitalea longa]|uniref:S1 motif domain-containing protein n=1 Tax=Vallitalea longa TaxID=2936439 RepID=A0A9W6DIW1_9FIRM|nr:hypothetical protein [Vallitalea longa]GKX32314.1 hypothetical protein SH1V18_47940 [Vallitalea longa]
MELLEGMVVGFEDDHAVVKNDEGLYIIKKKEFGGVEKDNKIKNFIGAKIKFVVIGEENGKKIASRKKAMKNEREKKKNDIKIGNIVEVSILLVLKKVIIVELHGKEIYVPVEDCVQYLTQDLRDLEIYKVGDVVPVKIIGTDPLKLSLKEAFLEKNFDTTYVKIKGQYSGKVVSIVSIGVFVKIPVIDIAILCRNVDWRRALQIGDNVVIDIEKISEKEHRIWGHILRYLK